MLATPLSDRQVVEMRGGIAGLNGCTYVDDDLVPGRLINCVNRATVTGFYYVGGIAGSFTGEMYRCGNEGTTALIGTIKQFEI
jgi:hypothetical protein